MVKKNGDVGRDEYRGTKENQERDIFSLWGGRGCGYE